jgi:protein O-mannosyl-transferase
VNDFKQPALVCLVLAILCLAIYLPGLDNEFVWDDELHLTRNPPVSSGLSPQSLRWALTTFHTGNWYPLTWVSHLVDVELFGLKPRGHHLTNLFLHCANAILTFLVLRRLTGALRSSALVAALFAVHPLHVESVAWVAERKDVLSTFLWLLALAAWLGWLRRPRPARYAAAVALFALALGAKAMPVTFPFLLLLLDFWPLGRFSPGRRLALAAEKLPLAAMAAAAAAVAFLAQSAIGAVGTVPFLVRAANAVRSYWMYVGKALWPARLALLYPYPEEAPSLALTVGAVAGLAAATAVALRLRRSSPAVAVGWLWFLGTLVPVIGLVQVGTQALADRYTYVPLTGLFIAAIWGIGGLARSSPRRAPWLAAGAALAVALLASTARFQVGLWRDPPAALNNVLNVAGENLIAHKLLAVYYEEHGNDRLAEEHVHAALAISGSDAGTLGIMAAILAKQGRTEEAIGAYHAAILSDPRSAEPYNNLGVLLAGAGREREAEENLGQALNLSPGFAGAHANLGRLLARQGRMEEALPHFSEAVRLSPKTALHHADLGAALATLGRRDEAVSSLREALRLDPGLAIARENLVKALFGRGARGE